jgi:extracellular factor (EF) 3-hydroxypalmitic acid methyl ester biosynthesis protein
LTWIHERLAPGGKVVLGNFHPRNPDRAFMDYVLDWRLIHRDEQDMNRMFQASKFKAPCSDIKFEGEGINLFAMGIRS